MAGASGAVAFARRAAWVVPAAAAAAVLTAVLLPRRDVIGPVGATCPDLGSFLGYVLGALAVTSAVAGAAVVAAAVVEVVRRAATGGTAGRVVLALVVPYVAFAAWLIPAFCDYS